MASKKVWNPSKMWYLILNTSRTRSCNPLGLMSAISRSLGFELMHIFDHLSPAAFKMTCLVVRFAIGYLVTPAAPLWCRRLTFRTLFIIQRLKIQVPIIFIIYFFPISTEHIQRVEQCCSHCKKVEVILHKSGETRSKTVVFFQLWKLHFTLETHGIFFRLESLKVEGTTPP